jgi:anti-anti-sigma regulatory factor
MLRINQSRTSTLATVDVDGKLVGPWVDELGTTVTALQREQPVCVNLQHLSFADAAGLSLLCTLRNDGVLLIGASPLIDGLLKSRGDHAAGLPGAGAPGA